MQISSMQRKKLTRAGFEPTASRLMLFMYSRWPLNAAATLALGRTKE